MDLLEKSGVKKLFIYHLPSEKTDDYSYRKSAIQMAARADRQTSVPVELLLDELKECEIQTERKEFT